MEPHFIASQRYKQLRGAMLQEILDQCTDPAGKFAKQHNQWLEINVKVAENWKGMVKLPKDQILGGAFVDAHRSSPEMSKKLKAGAEAELQIAHSSDMYDDKEMNKRLRRKLFRGHFSNLCNLDSMMEKTLDPKEARNQIQRWVFSDIECFKTNLQKEIAQSGTEFDRNTTIGFFEEWSAWNDMTYEHSHKANQTELHAESYLIFSTIQFAVNDMEHRLSIIEEALTYGEREDCAAADKLYLEARRAARYFDQLDSEAAQQAVGSVTRAFRSKKRKLLDTSNDTPGAPNRARAMNSSSDIHFSTAKLTDTQRTVSSLQETHKADKVAASENSLVCKARALSRKSHHAKYSGRREKSLPSDQLAFFAGDTGLCDDESEDLKRAIALSLTPKQDYAPSERVGKTSFGVYNIPCAFDDLPQDSKLEGISIEIDPYTAKLEFKFQGLPFGELGGFADVEHAEWVIDPNNMSWMSYSHPKSNDAILELIDNGGDESVPLYIEFTGKREMHAFIDYSREWMAPSYQENVFERQTGAGRIFDA